MKLHLVGDSIFARREGAPEAMIAHLLKQKVANLVIHNSAVSGYQTTDLLAQVPVLRQVEICDYLCILIGANDLALNKQIALHDFEANLRQLTASLADLYVPDQIVLLTPTPVDEDKQIYRQNGLVENYGQVVKALCQQAGYRCIDAYALFVKEGQRVGLAQLLEGALDDGLHFGRQGYDLLAESLVEGLSLS